MTSVMLISSIALGAFFELHTIPLDEPAQRGAANAITFFANADNDRVADLFILQRNKLSVVSRAGGVRETVLPQGVSAFDVADVDGDDVYEIVAVQGRNILRMPLSLQGDMPEPSTLFEADSLYAGVHTGPTPTVLVVPLDASTNGGKLGVLLPTNSGTELRAANGDLVRQTPYAETRSEFSVYRAEYSPADSSLDLVFNAISTHIPGAQPDPARASADVLTHDALNALSLRNAAKDQVVNWPWFNVRSDKLKMVRAYCAIEESLNTVVRMCDVAVGPDGTAEGAIEPGPERRYPGAMVTPSSEPPDFNGDGYADLLLWNAPQPGISVDSLLRAVVGRNWPITLSVHLYSPVKGRFEPAAATTLTYRIPATWFLTGPLPLRHHVLSDFNGDGKTDLAMCTEENEYAVWLYSDGFAATPDEKQVFPETITAIEQTADVAAKGKTSIVLRSDKHIFVLYAK